MVLLPNDEEVANSSKKHTHSRLECTNHTLFQTKIVEIDTLFQTKTAKKAYPLARHGRRSNIIPWCTSFHVILSLRTWHIMISNLQHVRNEHRSARCGWFQTCVGLAASAFEIIELACIRYALKENFSVTLTKKGFYMCFTDLSRTTACALGRTVKTKYKTRQLISFARFTRRTQAWGEPKPWLI